MIRCVRVVVGQTCVVAELGQDAHTSARGLGPRRSLGQRAYSSGGTEALLHDSGDAGLQRGVSGSGHRHRGRRARALAVRAGRARSSGASGSSGGDTRGGRQGGKGGRFYRRSGHGRWARPTGRRRALRDSCGTEGNSRAEEAARRDARGGSVEIAATWPVEKPGLGRVTVTPGVLALLRALKL